MNQEWANAIAVVFALVLALCVVSIVIALTVVAVRAIV